MQGSNADISALLRQSRIAADAAGGTARAGGKGEGGATGGAGGIDSEFAALLARAREGAITSGLPVVIDRGVGVELSDEQLLRLSQATDRAEAAGFDRALVLLDGMALVVDVEARSVVARGDAPGVSGVLAGIGGVVNANEAGSAAASGGASLAALGTRSEGARAILEQIEQRRATG